MIYNRDNRLFATGFTRIVRGARGTYVEFTKDQIVPLLVNHFDDKNQNEKDYYYQWLNPIYSLLVIEDQSESYVSRTYRNASADVTLAFAKDYNTSGEKCTKNAVLQNKKLYIPVNLLSFQDIIYKIVELGKNKISINIAGNGIHTLSKHSVSQVDCDRKVLLFLSSLKLYLEKEGVEIYLIRSGGQTGYDESGIKAALELEIPALIVCPKDYKIKTKDATITNKNIFLSRFSKYDNQIIKVYHQFKTVKYADYKVGMYYVDINEFLDFKDPEKLF